MSIHVLQTFTSERGPAGRGTQDKPASHLVACGPEIVTRALEPEHRIEDIQRNHGFAVRRIRRARRNERCRGTGLADALVQNLAIHLLRVRQHQIMVHRHIVLAVRIVDTQWWEPRIHTKRPGLIRHNRHNPLPQFGIPQQLLKRPNHGHCGGHLLLARALPQAPQLRQRWHLQRLIVHPAFRQIPAQFFPAGLKILDLRAVLTWVIIRRQVWILLQLLIRDGNTLLIAQLLQILQCQLLHLVGSIPALEVAAQAVTLNGVRQNHCRSVLGFQGPLVCRIDLAVVVPTTRQLPNLRIGPVFYQLGGPGILAKEMLPHVGAIVGLHRLEVAVGGGVHQIHQRPFLIGFEQLIPFAAPHDLNNRPASAPEEGLQLLNDLRVTTHWAV